MTLLLADLSAFCAKLAQSEPVDRLRGIREAINGRIIFTTSFGLEDQVLTHLVVSSGIEVEFVTLDTGRFFPETYTLWRETEARYDIRIRGFYPRHEGVEGLVATQGIDGFYASLDARKACCSIRKVEPLQRALSGASGWLTGLRADQSTTREAASFAESDARHGLIKLNPLLDWTRLQAAHFAQTNEIPINPLHGRGFLSIGCAPCTRAVLPGEPERAGRWWWEDENKKECGLHVGSDGRITRPNLIQERST